MTQPPFSNSSEKSTSDQPFPLPHYDDFSDYNSEIAENSQEYLDKKSEKDDWDSFGDLILFI